MTDRRQTQLVTALTAIFITVLVFFIVLMTYQQLHIQSTIDTNAARRDTQLNGLICVARLVPNDLTSDAVLACLQGVTP